MIPKIICYIFGHKRYDKQIKGTRFAVDGTLIVDYFYGRLNVCPRCGKNLLTSNKRKEEVFEEDFKFDKKGNSIP